MKLLLTLVVSLFSASAFAHGNVSCPVMPKEEKKPQMELQRKLEAEGWKIRQVKNFNNCYEVYGFDAKGNKMEVFFNPKTFERVYAEGEQPAAAK
ncbi:PepSY domain-containing protein [Burkholderiaceae bacterium DAT-1]|nr:PepSY domain-containing protein [Burkholderiaceae bacterium DAT-1]